MSAGPIPPVGGDDAERIAARLRHNVIAWLTTVDASGQPWTTPVWFLHRPDGTLLLYTPAGSAKLRHIAANPRVSLALDVSDLGRNIVRVRGTAHVDGEQPSALDNDAYRTKYAERVAAMFGDIETFSARFSVPIVLVPSHVGA